MSYIFIMQNDQRGPKNANRPTVCGLMCLSVTLTKHLHTYLKLLSTIIRKKAECKFAENHSSLIMTCFKWKVFSLVASLVDLTHDVSSSTGTPMHTDRRLEVDPANERQEYFVRGVMGFWKCGPLGRDKFCKCNCCSVQLHQYSAQQYRVCRDPRGGKNLHTCEMCPREAVLNCEGAHTRTHTLKHTYSFSSPADGCTETYTHTGAQNRCNEKKICKQM